MSGTVVCIERLLVKEVRALSLRCDHMPVSPTRARCWMRAGSRCARPLLSLAVWLTLWQLTHGQISAPPLPTTAPILIEASRVHRWQEGAYDVVLVSGGCSIAQGATVATSQDAVLWIDRATGDSVMPSRVVAYLEGNVIVDHHHSGTPHGATDRAANSIVDRKWLGRFKTTDEVRIRFQESARASPDDGSLDSDVLRRARQEWNTDIDNAVQLAQFTQEVLPLPPVADPQPSARRIRIQQRTSVGSQWKSYPSADPNETIIAINSGVRIIISGIENVDAVQSGTVTIDTDRAVIWTTALGGLVPGADQAIDGRWEVYLEGNIVYRDGDRVIYADRMYYSVNDFRGTILNAEMLTPVMEYEGLVRLKADVLQQADRQNFVGHGAALTSSRLGIPRYWFQSETITFQDKQQPVVDPATGQPVPDSVTGNQAVGHEMLATSRNNFLYLGGVPALYWPVMATDLKKPSFYVDRVRLKNDSIFGTQVMVDWDIYQLLGWDSPPEETKWTVSTDWLSDRGPAGGTRFSYGPRPAPLLPGQVSGIIDAWGIHDTGLDNLGADRRGLNPERTDRGRVFWQHRHFLPYDLQFTAEFGLISDRNLLEQYYLQEWDEWKDQSTGIELKQHYYNSTWSISGDVRLNDFFTQTEWLPRADHYLLGQSLLHDTLNWSAHSHAGYARLRTAVPPSPINPTEVAKFDPLAWEADREGLHAATRHEISAPISAGPVKVVPYALGEAFQIGEDLTGQERTRLYGQAGVRASLPMWRADPMAQSPLFNLNGLAHKVSFEADFFAADADQDLGTLPLYEQLDDDAIEAFRRRFYFDTFAGVPGGNVPLAFDERYFALRSGMQSWVTAPSTEIADDLMMLRGGVRQRWQTKRGIPGQQRIVDWIVFDMHGSFFPRPTRDNFGEHVGMLDYDFRWHVGDRVTILSDGFADLFGSGLRTASLGGFITRPERGSAYLGFRTIEGPISSNILSGAARYRLTDKWIVGGGASFDFGQVGNIGQHFELTRVGESVLLRAGMNVDASRGNVGVNFAIEPRFLGTSKLGRVGGVQIPPAGARGLE